jgi:CheY-like chemotaxis protein
MPPMSVVHVEDERPLRDILGIAFRAAEPGINLQQFTSGDEALGYIEANGTDIDLFVLDIRLPGTMNGVQIAQKVRDLHLPGYIVLTSAYQAPDPFLLSSLHSEYYPKPWHLFELTEKLLKYRLSKAAAPAKDAATLPTPATPTAAAAPAAPTAAPTTASTPASAPAPSASPAPTAPVTSAPPPAAVKPTTPASAAPPPTPKPTTPSTDQKPEKPATEPPKL